MPKLLLVSSSTVHGTGYLDHAAEEIARHFERVGRVLFVPWALHDCDAYADKARERFARLGIGLDSIHCALDVKEAVAEARGIFIGGGNTFRLLKRLYDEGIVEAIRKRAQDGMPYLGASAGSNVAGLTIGTTNDMPIAHPPSFDALKLIPFNLNPHYLEPDPASTHMGETRDQRIREFHEENPQPVLGLKEGAMLRVDAGGAALAGSRGARLFRRGLPHQDLEPDARVDFLL